MRVQEEAVNLRVQLAQVVTVIIKMTVEDLVAKFLAYKRKIYAKNLYQAELTLSSSISSSPSLKSSGIEVSNWEEEWKLARADQGSQLCEPRKVSSTKSLA